jgi:hypothetical protein
VQKHEWNLFCKPKYICIIPKNAGSDTIRFYWKPCRINRFFYLWCLITPLVSSNFSECFLTFFNSTTKSVDNICATKTDRYIFGRLPHIYQPSAKLEKQVHTFEATSTTWLIGYYLMSNEQYSVRFYWKPCRINRFFYLWCLITPLVSSNFS